MGKLAYALPQDPAKVVSQLIGAIPNTWSWLNGQLDAPLDFVAAGFASINAGWVISRFHDLQIATLFDSAVCHTYGYEEHDLLLMQRREAVLPLLTHEKLPGFLRFDEAAFDKADCGIIPMASVKAIATAFVERGYCGDLEFRSDCYDDCGSYNPERCDIHLAAFWEMFPRHKPLDEIKPFDPDDPSTFQPFLPRERQPALVLLAWEEKYGGSRENLDSLVAVCEGNGLTELDAAEVKPGHSYIRRSPTI